jgi:hypothetical protein
VLLDEEINTQWTDAAEDFKSLPSGNDLKESSQVSIWPSGNLEDSHRHDWRA